MKKKVIKWEAWADKNSVTFCTADSVQDMMRKGLIEKDAEMIFSIETNSYESAQGAYHRHMGWGPYIPWGEREEEQLRAQRKKKK